jgi:hypothetical protein
LKNILLIQSLSDDANQPLSTEKELGVFFPERQQSTIRTSRNRDGRGTISRCKDAFFEGHSQRFSELGHRAELRELSGLDILDSP